MKGSLGWLARTNAFFTRVVFNMPQDKQILQHHEHSKH